jgi:exopolysaccharide biosynthesis polyprenyl glycosylphosphotransferase
MLQRSSARYVMALYLADLILTVCALFVARWARMFIPYGQSLDVGGSTLSWPMFLLAAIIWSVTLSTFKAYNPQRFTHAIDELQIVVAAITVATLVFAGALYFSYRGLSRLLYVYFYVLDIVLCLAARIVLRKVLGTRRSAFARGVLIVGTGTHGQSIAHALEPCAWMGIEVKGYLDANPDQIGRIIGRYPVLGTLGQAAEVIAQQAIREVVIALPMDAHSQLANLVSTLQALSVNIKVVPDYSGMIFFRATLEQLGDVFLFGLKEPVIGPIDRIIKRLFDLSLSVLGLIVLSPLLAMIALDIALGSPGPVLYKSRRVGEGGRVFDMLKFRTMVPDADKSEAALVFETAEGRLMFDKRRDDPRITPLGRFLRRYSLDELPQLYNVLVGEMSLVGPRPELPSLVDRYESWQRKRFGVPQGMTGWWQISGRGNKAKYLHVEDDLYYIQNYSLVLDVTILWRTLGAVLKGDGAF